METCTTLKLSEVVTQMFWFYFLDCIDELLTDVNECLVFDLNDCHRNAVCNNTAGSYDCACKLGFSGIGADCESKKQNCISLTFLELSGILYKAFGQTQTEKPLVIFIS